MVPRVGPKKRLVQGYNGRSCRTGEIGDVLQSAIMLGDIFGLEIEERELKEELVKDLYRMSYVVGVNGRNDVGCHGIVLHVTADIRQDLVHRFRGVIEHIVVIVVERSADRERKIMYNDDISYVNEPCN